VGNRGPTANCCSSHQMWLWVMVMAMAWRRRQRCAAGARRGGRPCPLMPGSDGCSISVYHTPSRRVVVIRALGSWRHQSELYMLIRYRWLVTEFHPAWCALLYERQLSSSPSCFVIWDLSSRKSFIKQLLHRVHIIEMGSDYVVQSSINMCSNKALKN
jgi:hypothetical protein